MKTSSTGINLIKMFESLHDGDLKQIGLQPKMCPAGIWTEGYGHAMRDDKGVFIKGIENKKLAYSRISVHNEAEAMKTLKSDLSIYENVVSRKVKIVLNQNQYDALVSYVYNTGGSQTLYDLVNKKASEKDIRKWIENHYITSNNVIMPGLIKRRKAESNLFFHHE